MKPCPAGLQLGDLAVWDGHVAMVVDNGMTIEPMYQYGCRTTAVMPLPRPTPCVPRSQAFSPTVTCLYSARVAASSTGEPQPWQNRAFSSGSVPHVRHAAMAVIRPSADPGPRVFKRALRIGG